MRQGHEPVRLDEPVGEVRHGGVTASARLA